MKRYFVQYTEAKENLLISDSPRVRMFTSFNKGVHVSYNAGHSRKKDAIAWADRVNAAVGKKIAFYYGAIDVNREDRYVISPDSQSAA